MRIILISEWLGENMGYAETELPRALAELGHEVHIITANVKPYFNSPDYKKTYEKYFGPPIVPCGSQKMDGYTLHRLPYKIILGRIWIKGLLKKITSLKPAIIQTFDVCSLIQLEALLGKLFSNSKLFLGCHIHASVFTLELKKNNYKSHDYIKKILAFMLGRFISFFAEKCYPISIDCAYISKKYFGVPENKIKVQSLGVNTHLFHQLENQDIRCKKRKELNFNSNDIVCIYTGRFSKEKNPVVLAQTIELLSQNNPSFKGLFIGEGPQKSDILKSKNCIVLPFVSFHQLPEYYWASDIAVFPRQETTSQLDAIACGLPIIISNKTSVQERVEGNGLFYCEDMAQDLAEKLKLLVDPQIRKIMGEHGINKVQENYSWLKLAKNRENDYNKALQK